MKGTIVLSRKNGRTPRGTAIFLHCMANYFNNVIRLLTFTPSLAMWTM